MIDFELREAPTRFQVRLYRMPINSAGVKLYRLTNISPEIESDLRLEVELLNDYSSVTFEQSLEAFLSGTKDAFSWIDVMKAVLNFLQGLQEENKVKYWQY